MDGDDLAADRALVERIAKEVIGEFGAHSLKADMLQAGFVGLLDARSRFDASKAIPFPGFAYRRIRGEMLGSLRKSKTLSPRTLERIRRAAKIEPVLEQGTEEVSEKPPTGELAAAAAISALLGKAAVAYVADVSASVERHGTEEGVVTQVDAAKVRDTVGDLPERLRNVVIAYFYEDRSLAEIGAAADGKSERWARWLLAEALDMLKEMLR